MKLLRRNCEIIAVYGGDGTLGSVYNALVALKIAGRIKEFPAILPLGGGTMNATYLALRQESLTAAQQIAFALHGQTDRWEIPLFEVSSEGHESVYGLFVFYGVVAKLCAQLNAGPKSKLIFGLKILLAAICSLVHWRLWGSELEPEEACVSWDDGTRLEGKVLLGIYFMLSDLPLRFRPFQVRDRTAEMGVGITTLLSARSVAARWFLFFRSLWVPRATVNRPFATVTIQQPGQKPVCIMVEGDPHPMGSTVAIRVCPDLRLPLVVIPRQ